MKYLIKYPLVLLLLMSSLSSLAQLEPIQIQLTVPYRQHVARIDELKTMLNNGDLTLILTNTTNETLIFHLEVALTSSAFSVVTNPIAPTTLFSLGPKGVLRFDNNSDPDKLASLFYEDSFMTGDGQSLEEYFTSDGRSLFNPQIPEGDYELCIRVRPEVLNQQLTNLLSNVGCAAVPMKSYTAPLISRIGDMMFCGGNITPLADANFSFPINWSAPIINENGVPVTNYSYNLFIVELLPEFGGDPNQVIQALQNGTEPRQFTVIKRDISGNGSLNEMVNLQSNDFSETLKIGSQYVVVVQAQRNDGLPVPYDYYSPACTFTYGAEAEDVEPTPDPDMAGLPPECKDGDCYKIPLPTTAGEDVGSLAENSVVRVGCFWVTVKNATASGTGFNGEGTVQIPFFAAKFKVALKNLVVQKFGTLLVAVSGVAEGLPDASYPATGPIATAYKAFQDAKPAVLETTGTAQAAGQSPLTAALSGVLYGNTATISNAATTLNSGATEVASTAETVFNAIRNIDRTIQQITSNEESGLPIGYSGVIGEQKLRFGIFSMTFTPKNATVTMVVETPIIPGINNQLYFGAMGVCITPKGISANNATFYLGGDINVGIGGHTLTLKGSGSDLTDEQITFLKLKEGDFETLKLSGGFTFDPATLKPKVGNGKLVADFGFEVTDFKDLMIDLTMSTPFTIAGHNDWTFTLSDLSLDLSSAKNPDGWAALPADMKTGLGTANEQNTWTGLFAKKLAIKLPDDFKLGDGKPASANITNFLIGFAGGGVSFDGQMPNLISIGDGGSLAGFGFWIDNFSASMRQSKFTALNFNGKIRFPMFDINGQNQGALPYNIDLMGEPGELKEGIVLEVEIKEGQEIVLDAKKALGASFTIREGSYIKYDSDAERHLTMRLNGLISVDVEGISLPDMKFEKFDFDGSQLNLDQFYVSFASPQKMLGVQTDAATGRKMGGFSVNVKEVRPVIRRAGSKWDLGLGFHLYVNLLGGDSEEDESWSFKADADIEITGKLNDKFEPEPVFSVGVGNPKVFVGEMSFDTDITILHVAGGLKYYKDHPTFGTAIRGGLQVEFKLEAMPIKGALEGMFGSKDGYKYFYIDGRIDGLKINIGTTPIALTGFVGGISYNMKADEDGNAKLSDRFGGDMGQLKGSPPFIPESGKFGVAFGVLFAESGTGFTYNGMMALGAQIDFDRGGLDFLKVGGYLDFMKNPTAAVNEEMKIHASLDMMYDFPRKTFSGDFAVALNIGDAIVGDAEMRMYISPDVWFVYLGNPYGHTQYGLNNVSPYAQVSFKIPDTEIDLAQAGAYFCIGNFGIDDLPTSIPNLPGMSPEQRNKLIASRRSMRFGPTSGEGIAFGAYFYIGIDKRLGSDDAYLRATLNLGGGFDVALYSINRDLQAYRSGL